MTKSMKIKSKQNRKLSDSDSFLFCFDLELGKGAGLGPRGRVFWGSVAYGYRTFLGVDGVGITWGSRRDPLGIPMGSRTFLGDHVLLHPTFCRGSRETFIPLYNIKRGNRSESGKSKRIQGCLAVEGEIESDPGLSRSGGSRIESWPRGPIEYSRILLWCCVPLKGGYHGAAFLQWEIFPCFRPCLFLCLHLPVPARPVPSNAHGRSACHGGFAVFFLRFEDPHVEDLGRGAS